MPLQTIDLASFGALGFKIGGAKGLGSSATSAGDINGDGYDDFIVGAPLVDFKNGSNFGGAAYVIFGKASAFGDIDLASLAAADGFKITGAAAGDRLGGSVSAAGDINGDGYDDIIVAARDNDAGGSGAGAAYVIFGKASGFGNIDLTAFAPADGFRIVGDADFDSLGRVRSGGDINNDGYDDILIGAPDNDSGGASTGTSYVLFGKASGFADLDLAALNPAAGFKIHGETAGDQAGVDLSSAGDINGDGFDDIIIGASGNDSAADRAGAAYVIFGKASGFGDINLASLAAADGFKIEGASFMDFAGGHVSSAGDINNDGYDDIFVGATQNDAAGDNAGTSYVIFGKGSGFANIDLATLAMPDGFRIIGEAAGDFAAGSLGTGDFNGDGYADLLIGSFNDEGGVNAGAAYVIFGKASGFADVNLANLSAADGLKILGDLSGDAAGTVVSSAGDINNDGYDDIIVGAPNHTANGTDYVIYGSATFSHDNVLTGNSNEVLAGGDGNDTYFVNSPNVQVVELPNQGNDIIYTSVSYTLQPGQTSVETLAVNGQTTTTAINLEGNALVNILAGNNGNNILNGGGGADVMSGFLGDDIYFVDTSGDQVIEASGGGNDIIYTLASYVLSDSQFVETLSAADHRMVTALGLIGNQLANNIYGNSGNNLLDGGGGADAMLGFAGDDIFFVDNAGDVVVEHANEGNDTVYTLVSFALGADVHVETLSAANHALSTPISLTGNGFANNIYGNVGNNILNGGAGADIMLGFAGNDIFYVDNAGDMVVEHANEGNDIVYTSVGYTLGAGSSVETLSVNDHGATSAINLTGNEIGNNVYGNSGANVLDGGGGADLLLGFGGADTFAFTTALGASNVDLVADFVSGTDKIGLDDAIFTALGGPGALNANAFFAGTAAHDADDRIIYDSNTGALYYDADGNGAGGQILFATLYNHPVITASDFQVI